MIRLTLDLRPLAKALAQLQARLGDLTPTMEKIAQYWETRVGEFFEEERGPGGVPWPKSIRARLTGGQTLSNTGRLRQSITTRVTPRSVSIGTNVIYAAIHHLGGTITAKNAPRLKMNIPGVGWRSPQSVVIPARPFLPAGDEVDREEISHIIAEDLAAAGAA